MKEDSLGKDRFERERSRFERHLDKDIRRQATADPDVEKDEEDHQKYQDTAQTSALAVTLTPSTKAPWQAALLRCGSKGGRHQTRG